jgi:hypothetical protein
MEEGHISRVELDTKMVTKHNSKVNTKGQEFIKLTKVNVQ